MKPSHVLLATVEPAHDPNAWSGTAFNIRVAVEAAFDRVSVLCNPVPRKHWTDAVPRLLLGRERYPMWMTQHALQGYATALREAISQHQPDAVLCISSQHLALLGPVNVPLYMVSDAPWLAYKTAYASFETMPWRSRSFAQLEAEAAHAARRVIYPTPWSCMEAARLFGVSADKIAMIPLGANRFCRASDAAVDAMISERLKGEIRLLFVGKDWERKGGPQAVAVTRALRARGLLARLQVVGCQPALTDSERAFVNVSGFLSADDPVQAARLENAFVSSDLFILPSTAECFGLVLAEAQSYGLPCLALKVHGVPGVVSDGSSGLLFSPGTSAATMAQSIMKLASDRDVYTRMSQQARMRFVDKLNWNAFGQQLRSLMVASHPQ